MADMSAQIDDTDIAPAAAAVSTTASYRYEIPDMTKPDDFADVTLVTDDDRRLYTCRGILASASPVWRRAFVADMKDTAASAGGEVTLTDKRFEDVLELLMCISPAIQKPVTDENVLQILPLADEYQMQKLKDDCECLLLYQLDTLPTPESQLQYLSMAQKHGLQRLVDSSVCRVSELPLGELERQPGYADIDADVLLRILKRRVETMEERSRKLAHSTETWRRKCDDVEDCLKRMSREKITIKRVLDEIEGAWDLKGSDARCIDPVHIYGPRNYSCDKCTRQVCTYIQAKIWYLTNRGCTRADIAWSR